MQAGRLTARVIGAGPERARTEEDSMHPYISQMVAAERARDMHQRAAAAQRTALGGGPGRTWFWQTEGRGAKAARAARQPACGQQTTAAARS